MVLLLKNIDSTYFVLHRAGAWLDNKILGGLLEGESVDKFPFFTVKV